MAPDFAAQYDELRGEVRRLRARLAAEEYRQHPRVKLFAAVTRLVKDIVPQDPNRPEFRLKPPLHKFRRAKNLGMPPRYRLFWVFSSRLKTIIFLYLNDETTLRQEGGRNDPYEVFRRLLDRGEIGEGFDANYATWQRTQGSPQPRKR